MTFLLDTHVLLWWLSDDERLNAAHRQLITNANDEVLVSAITLAEISIKASLGKLEIAPGIETEIVANGFDFLPFDERHGAALRDLPFHHRDPFDRMLVAQTLVDDLTFLTVDERCKQYDIRCG